MQLGAALYQTFILGLSEQSHCFLPDLPEPACVCFRPPPPGSLVGTHLPVPPDRELGSHHSKPQTRARHGPGSSGSPGMFPHWREQTHEVRVTSRGRWVLQPTLRKGLSIVRTQSIQLRFACSLLSHEDAAPCPGKTPFSPPAAAAVRAPSGVGGQRRQLKLPLPAPRSTDHSPLLLSLHPPP